MAIRTRYPSDLDQATVRIKREDVEKIKEIQRAIEAAYKVRQPVHRIVHLAMRDYYAKVMGRMRA